MRSCGFVSRPSDGRSRNKKHRAKAEYGLRAQRLELVKRHTSPRTGAHGVLMVGRVGPVCDLLGMTHNAETRHQNLRPRTMTAA